jgi:hypothetical protein
MRCRSFPQAASRSQDLLRIAESARRLTALVTQSVQVGSTLGHLVDVIPHDPDGRVDLGLQRCGLRNPSYTIRREGFNQRR